jgi:hypothetical protein
VVLAARGARDLEDRSEAQDPALVAPTRAVARRIWALSALLALLATAVVFAL